MLSGHLPFDYDPSNLEGNNFYKRIVSTPLTCPEYVMPQARDLLRCILVPDPARRTDLFGIASHSWLSEYAHVVGFIEPSANNKSNDPMTYEHTCVREGIKTIAVEIIHSK